MGRNETYSHEFWFHDDPSDDDTYDDLMAQPDCGATQSKLRFGDRVGRIPDPAGLN